MVGYVKHLGTELHRETFLEFPILGDGKVQVVEAGVAENVAAGVAERAYCRRGQHGPAVEAHIATRPGSVGRTLTIELGRLSSGEVSRENSGLGIGASASRAE